MKVLLGPYLPEESGIAAYTLGIAEALVQAGVQVDLIVGRREQNLPTCFAQVELPQQPEGLEYLGGPFIKAILVAKWISEIDQADSTILHLTSPPYVPKRRAGQPPVVCSVFNFQDLTDILTRVPKTERGLRKLLALIGWLQFYRMDNLGIGRSEGVVLTASAARSRVERALRGTLSSHKVVFVPPTARGSIHPSGNRSQDQVIVLLAERDLGRPRNNVSMLLQGLELISRQAQGKIRVHLVGQGLSVEQLALISVLRAEGLSIETHGFLQKSEYLGLLSTTSVYVSIRDIWEQGSYGVVEAMSHGICCVTSSTPAYIDMVEPNSTGILVDAHSPASIAHALERLASDPEFLGALGRGASRKWELEFSPEVVGRHLIDLYTQVLAALDK